MIHSLCCLSICSEPACFVQVLNLLKAGECESFDTMSLLRNLGQVKTDLVDTEDGNIQSARVQEEEDLSKGKNESSDLQLNTFVENHFLFHCNVFAKELTCFVEIKMQNVFM